MAFKLLAQFAFPANVQPAHDTFDNGECFIARKCTNGGRAGGERCQRTKISNNASQEHAFCVQNYAFIARSEWSSPFFILMDEIFLRIR